MVPGLRGAGMPREPKGERASCGASRPSIAVDDAGPSARRRRSSTEAAGSAIARGSGTQVADVNRLLKQHAQLKKMMKRPQSRWKGRMGKLKGALPFLNR
mgnify:CR=1 FL=1